MVALKGYRKPRDVVSSLLKKGHIIRVRKGLYFLGSLWQKQQVSPEMLANLVYGPSAISLDYALAWYGLIPERVDTLTSITTGRSRIFDTPAGRFSYTCMSEKRFTTGLTLQESPSGNWLIAEPLKALADKIWTDKRFRPTSPASYTVYIFEDLRIEEATLNGLYTTEKVQTLSDAYASRKIDWLTEFLQKKFEK
jgi:hypothetical protein